MGDGLELARDCCVRRAWGSAFDAFCSLDAERPLGAEDLERLAVAAHLVGHDDESDEAWTKAHRSCVETGDLAGAVRCGFSVAFRLLNSFDRPAAGGWISRLERLVGHSADDSLEAGRLAYLTGLDAVFGGDLGRGHADLTRSAELADRHANQELASLGRLALGRVLIFRGELVVGRRLLDEAMLALTADGISPIAVGDSYCTAIDACHDLVDVRRGQTWTDALARWCAEQQDLVPFLGVCQVHRAEFLQLKGAWVEAMVQAGLARARLSAPFQQLAYGAAAYQQGELQRLRGDFGPAEACYREASAAGRDPQPGLALLRLAQGQKQAAAQALDRALAETEDPGSRSQLLAAAVEVSLETGDLEAAEASTDALAGLAAMLGSPLLDAIHERARGAVLIARGDGRSALLPLRRSASGFRDMRAPYEVARTSALIGAARLLLGDDEGARLEVEAARATYERLGARHDLTRLDALARGRDRTDTTLTAREMQVLRLVAKGLTNRSIGERLGLSERTVDRHVSKIFAKLGVSSRAAATSVAYESDLL